MGARSLIITRTITSMLALLGLFGLTGCTAWPEQGTGGMAERDPTALLSPVMPDRIPTEAQALRFDLELVSRHLDVLVLEGAGYCFPAVVAQARQRQYRINRELYGGLFFDGANDLIIQRQDIGRLERRLDYVKKEGSCIPPVNTGVASSAMPPPAGLIERKQHIELLLNSDNQFAFDSSELNPKYIGRLAEAVHLLRDDSNYQLRVIGHADEVGGDRYNLEISRERAEKVGRYLVILGLDEERITIGAESAEKPFFAGEEAHNRLVNRRVTIELTEQWEPVADQETVVFKG